ncbi:NAD(P)-binding protein [Thozetella sp. PMI_491]|nr:NAD(P)-binding protein [Thozetella sp. PMI_491]
MSITSSISPGSWVLVTGANGYIAAHVAKQFLAHGYKVRGTVRDISKSEWLKSELFAKEATSGSLELVVLNDVNNQAQFRTAVRGVAAVAHLATPNDWDPNPNTTIPETVNLLVNLLKAANAERSVKQFVYTSTIGAATMIPIPSGFHFDGTNWNEEAGPLAWAPPPYTPERGLFVYAASKVDAEKAFWKFLEDEKPGFIGNTIIVSTAFGPRLHQKQNASTSAWPMGIYNGDTSVAAFVPSAIFVDVRDVALLHVASVLDDSIKGSRLPAWNIQFDWNDVLAVFRKSKPGKTFPDDIKDLASSDATADTTEAKRILKNWAGQDDFISLEKSVLDTVAGESRLT